MNTMKPAFLIAFLLIPACLFAQDFAIKQLEHSPRHHEWVSIEYDGRTVHSFVAWPEVSEPALAVLIIHENRGLTDWVRSFADQVAEAGYIAIAPDLLSGYNEEYQRTRDFPTSDAARDALYELDPDQVTSDLDAVITYIISNPAADGKVAVAGFCWGGARAFIHATRSDKPQATLVFYGSAPADDSAIEQIQSPVYGFYGGNDERINAGIPAVEELMKASGKKFDYVIYPGAGHAFMRAGDSPEASPENKAAHDASWVRLKKILSEM